MTPFDRLLALLRDADARFRVIEHPVAGSSEQVARIRGTHPGQGAKAMLCEIRKCPGRLVLAVLPGNRKIDFRKVGEAVGGGKASLVSPDVARERTGCEIGAIPPFVFDPSLTLLADPDLFAQFDEIAFNAGRLDTSVVLNAQDYLRIATPQLVSIAVPEPTDAG